MPLDNWSPGVLQGLLPVLEARLVLLVLAPAQLDLTDRVPSTNQIVITNLNNSWDENIKNIFTFKTIVYISRVCFAT